jgi:hypothetical protein
VARWTWSLGGTPASGNGPQRQLTAARGRTITWRLDAACSAAFTIDGRNDEMSGWERLATDLFVWRDGTLVFRGRLCPEQGRIDAGGHTVTITAIDYRGMLDTKTVPETGASYSATDQAAIAWGLINSAQTRTNGSLGITNGIGSTSGTNRDRTYDPGKPIGEAIGELGRVDSGFEWEVGADLAFDRWYPTRGSDNGVVLDYPGRITAIDYAFDPGGFGNVAMAIGSNTTTPVLATSGTIATDPRGRWERAVASPSIVEQATLTARAPFLLAQMETIRVDYRVTLRPNTWGGPTDVWLGDTVKLAVKSGNVQESMTPHRVTEITATPGDDGTEAIQFALVAA